MYVYKKKKERCKLFPLYDNKIIAKLKNAKRINILIPDVKIKTDQEKTTNKVCPISG